ncbi:MAG: T9SS type A sorting domain-containing protein [Bacteroidia bacterium]|nr:T9SS type A sorting domain-containing protein [Bacteroidia bacterium]
MKKGLLTISFFLACASLAFAGKQSQGVELLSSSAEGDIVKLTMKGYDLKGVKTPQGLAYIIQIENGTPMLVKGAPNLPKVTFSLAIGDLSHTELEVVSTSYKELTGIEIAPSKGTLLRNTNPSEVPFNRGVVYSHNAFFPGTLGSLGEPYIVRDVRGQAVQLYPFQYNPVTKVLRVYDEIVVRVKRVDNNGSNPLVRTGDDRVEGMEFSQIYRNQFLNHDYQIQYTPLGEYGNMLIISYGQYMNAMQPFINWKKKIGIPVTMVDIATVGNNATAIKNYVENYYNSNGLTFLLLVGDAQHVASMYFSASGDSDNGYSYLVGNDRYPDILVGRFSAESVSDVSTMVNRTIRYEQFPQLSAGWYENGLGIASDQGPGDDNEMDYEHIRNIRTQLMNYTYSTVAELYDGSQGGGDASGNPTPSMVSSVISSGVGIINYTGHGSANSWVSSGFSNADVDALNNTDKYPFIFSVACVNGDFVGNTCFAEKWLRATDNNGAPAGAVGTLMSTINQYWNEPMEGMDEMNAILTETYQSNIKRTFTGIAMNGCMKMNDAYGTSGMDMTDTWTTFGDPSLFVRTDMQSTLTASHVLTENVGVTQLVVNSNTDGARVALTLNGNILGVGTISGGTATITFPAVTLPDTIHVAVTAYNKVPYFGIVEVLPLTGVVSAGAVTLHLTAYPTPANNHLYIMAMIPASETAEMELTDVTGKKVMEIYHGKGSTSPIPVTADISALPGGVYFLRLQAGGNSFVKKVIISR